MSTTTTRNYTCSVCGETHRYRILTSTNALGCPDLDTRPPQMKRNTMPLWVHACPSCGYSAEDVNDPTHITREYLRSEEYQTCSGMHFGERLASRFYRQHLILLHDRQFIRAFFAVLHAAWVCDDSGEKENAVQCRRIAADLMETAILPGESTDSYYVLYADVLRRSGQFEKLTDQLADVWLESEYLRKLLAFEYALAKRKIDGCYTVNDAETFYEAICEQLE